MFVNKNDPIEPNIVVERYDDGTTKRKTLGSPIRLMIATSIIADAHFYSDKSEQDRIIYALRLADALIKEHNNTYMNY